MYPHILTKKVILSAQPTTYLGQKANRQSATLQKCFNDHKSDVEWLAFIDIDEFIALKDKTLFKKPISLNQYNPLLKTLENYSKYPGWSSSMILYAAANHYRLSCVYMC